MKASFCWNLSNMLNMKENIYIFCANRRRVSDYTQQSVLLCFFKNVRRVSNIALKKQLPSARGLTLGEPPLPCIYFLSGRCRMQYSAKTSPSVFGPSPIALALIVFRLSRSGLLFSNYRSKWPYATNPVHLQPTEQSVGSASNITCSFAWGMR
jgi:hypothetical protein